jgi:hypothetical protein
MGTEGAIPPPTTKEDASQSKGSGKGKKGKGRDREASNAKRRCVSTACIACRKRKSKVDISSLRGTAQLTRPVRWESPKLCGVCIGLWHRMCL